MNEQLSLIPPDVESGATIDPTGDYRYDLWRIWEPGRTVNFIMLNPSKADGERDDPTTVRCMNFARSWGYGGIVLTNLYAFRATLPTGLFRADAPIGPDNDEIVVNRARASNLVVLAWGNHGAIRGRGMRVESHLIEAGVVPHALKLTGAGEPGHPLYIPGWTQPRPIAELRR